ncbi:glutamyl-tRNA reductase [Sunxiuqinia dokdonensis]|uniref:Glutamyl-tRNA reductase n=1 Tax=Sunxiuqinia dokdonensis TaxID=1409788 RepID=A0A0L8V5K2_9BACT|nr:glutamyl-tRNA reductase [Sunxiuqinia dokdonensis]KOH43497.1 glutamyl-tRNA reductase [Sunxiuqinia dokdonensis]
MIGVVGLSHKSAPVHIREKFALNKEEYTDLSQTILKNKNIGELVIISTCNRTELYFTAEECCSPGAFHILFHYLKKHINEEDGFESHFYQYETKNAVNHLFRVVSGLESMMLGEYQIVSQIKEAISHAEEIGSAGKILTRLFHKALETGKQVRTKTAMSTGAFSVSYAAVEKCSSIFEQLPDKKILLIGAGETGELVIKNLYKKGCQNIVVTNRTTSKAEELAQRFYGTAHDFNELSSAVRAADIVVSSISCKAPLITPEILGTENTEKQTVFIDLGVPRNIDPRIAVQENITLYNVDDLEEVVAQNMEKKKTYVATAEKIIAKKTNEFGDWLSIQNLSPAIQNIMLGVNEINQSELALFKKFHNEEEYQNMEKYGKHIAEKLVKSMIRNLKNISDNGRKTEYIKVINDLFSPSHD